MKSLIPAIALMLFSAPAMAVDFLDANHNLTYDAGDIDVTEALSGGTFENDVNLPLVVNSNISADVIHIYTPGSIYIRGSLEALDTIYVEAQTAQLSGIDIFAGGAVNIIANTRLTAMNIGVIADQFYAVGYTSVNLDLSGISSSVVWAYGTYTSAQYAAVLGDQEIRIWGHKDVKLNNSAFTTGGVSFMQAIQGNIGLKGFELAAGSIDFFARQINVQDAMFLVDGDVQVSGTIKGTPAVGW